MTVFLITVAVVIVAGSIFADYKWRHWIDHHRRDRRD